MSSFSQHRLISLMDIARQVASIQAPGAQGCLDQHTRERSDEARVQRADQTFSQNQPDSTVQEGASVITQGAGQEVHQQLVQLITQALGPQAASLPASLCLDVGGFGGAASLAGAGPQHISFFAHGPKEVLKTTKAGLCFVLPQDAHLVPPETLAWQTSRPHRTFLSVLSLLHPQPAPPAPGIHPTAVIHPGAVIHPSAHIGPHSVIGPNVEIHEGCVLLAGCVIGPDVTLGAFCQVQSLATIQHTQAGSYCVFESGCRVGLAGFGFLVDDLGMVDLPHLGRVRIGSHSHIGANTTVDRGTLEDTVIGSWVRLDNLVQIGHNVQIGNHVVMASMCGIAGSCTIQDGAMLGGQVGVADHVTIGTKAKIAAKSGVMKDVLPHQTVAGFPAVPAAQWKRTLILQARMVKGVDS